MGAKDTVIALSSGKGKSAIAVIRVSGPGSFPLVETCLSPKSLFGAQGAKTVGLFTFIDTAAQTQQKIDHITAIKYCGPHSYTGEDMVELFCHGSEIVVEKIMTCLIARGAVYAEKGEFTRRAFINGKFDLVKAESVLGIIDSKSDREYASSVDAYFGGTRKKILIWKNGIKNVLKDIEAGIEFPEEDDVCEKEQKTNIDRIEQIIKDIEKDIKKRQKAKIIEKGINVPIVGIPNAGKSSLFNLLLESDRSIVHWKEGTTRDSVSEEVQIGNEKIRLIDTAGLRKTKNPVEQIGIAKTKELIRSSAMVLWITPADKSITAFEKEMVLDKAMPRIICVISKEDLGITAKKEAFCKEKEIPFISLCLLDIQQRERMVSFFREQIDKKIGAIETPSIIRNQRQETAANRLLQNLSDAQKNRKSGEEVYARFLQRALEEIGQIIGETTTEEILNSIFSEFCIGK